MAYMKSELFPRMDAKMEKRYWLCIFQLRSSSAVQHSSNAIPREK